MGFSVFLFLPGSTGPAGTQSAAGLFLEFIHKSFPSQSKTRTDVCTALLRPGHMVRNSRYDNSCYSPCPLFYGLPPRCQKKTDILSPECLSARRLCRLLFAVLAGRPEKRVRLSIIPCICGASLIPGTQGCSWSFNTLDSAPYGPTEEQAIRPLPFLKNTPGLRRDMAMLYEITHRAENA